MKLVESIIYYFLLAPIAFQIIFGWFSIRRKIKLKFKWLCLISLIMHVLISYLNIIFISSSLRDSNIKCGLPIVGLFLISIILVLILCLIIIIETIFNHLLNKKNKPIKK